jgi:3-phosphoshikimate 1-carboxyvinyltransferase
MLGACAIGTTTITGLLEGEDVHRTAEALRGLGTKIDRDEDGTWHIRGVGVGGLAEPHGVLEMGNSGTAARLLMGLLATHDFTSFLTGDASLCLRPMGRVITPLSQMGAAFTVRGDGRLPLSIKGASLPVPLYYVSPVASAQVKSAVLLAGLNAPGATSVIESAPTRDHTERMLRHFGAQVEISDEKEGRVATVTGWPELSAQNVTVPADPSSAAFPLVAALITENSEITVQTVGLNPLRAGLFDTLLEMGADLSLINEREDGGEPVADLVARYSDLQSVDVPPERAPAMIDEYPILAAAAAMANGTTRFNGVGELRVKESDRLAAVSNGLRQCGVAVREGEDWLEIDGSRGEPVAGTQSGVSVATHMDHRIAMAFLTLGLRSRNGVAVDDVAMIDTSFPGFAKMLTGLGAHLSD